MDIICLFHKLLDNIHEKTRGGIAAWDCGLNNIGGVETIAYFTVGKDFSSDIFSRAQYFAENGY